MEANGKGETAGRKTEDVMIYNSIVTNDSAIHLGNQ